MKFRFSALCLLITAMVFTFGCAKKADPNKPIDQIKAEVEKMSVNDLQATAQAYAKEIKATQVEVDKVKEKFKGMSPMDLFGEKGKGIREQATKLASEVSELTKRYTIYADKLRAKGGDLSKIKI